MQYKIVSVPSRDGLCTTRTKRHFLSRTKERFQRNSARASAEEALSAPSSELQSSEDSEVLESPPSLQNDSRTAAEEALEMLEWDRICSTVATFASTSSGQQQAGLLLLPDTQEGSEALIRETAAALTLDASASGDCLDFGRIDTKAAEYGLYKARKGVPMSGEEMRLFVLSSNTSMGLIESKEWW